MKVKVKGKKKIKYSWPEDFNVGDVIYNERTARYYVVEPIQPKHRWADLRYSVVELPDIQGKHNITIVKHHRYKTVPRAIRAAFEKTDKLVKYRLKGIILKRR